MSRKRSETWGTQHPFQILIIPLTRDPNPPAPSISHNGSNVPCLAFAECEKMAFPTVGAAPDLRRPRDGP
jgi:hypothetical protein